MQTETVPKHKILHIVEAMGGGVFSYIVDLTNNLCDDCEVVIAYALRPQTPLDFASYFDKRIKLIEVKNFTRSISLKHDIRAFLEIKKIYREVQPDIVHLHSSKAGILGRWSINGRRVKIFYTPHGYAFLRENEFSLKRYIYKFFEWVSAKRKCTTIACSKGEYEATLGLTKDATYINNGINVDEFEELALNMITHNDGEIKNNESLKICTVGRICYQKHPELFNQIAEGFPDIRFTWIGDGEMRNELTSPNIWVTGWVDRKAALEFLNQSDVFLLPSLWEGLPISLLEAMYFKKICIVSNVIGNKDVIRHGENGFLVNDLMEYTVVINSLLNGEYDTKTMKEVSHTEVIENYTATMMKDKYLLLYKESIFE